MAALDFPPTPSVGDIFEGWMWDGTKWVRIPQIPPAQLMVSVGPTPPGSPAEGFLWWDAVGGNLYIWYIDATSSQWVIANLGVMGPTGPQGPPGPAVPAVTLQASVPTASDLPTTGNTAGDARITVDTGDLWVWDGAVWFNAGPIQGPPGVAGAPGPQGPAGPPGPVGEAPTDGQYYVRQGSTASWEPGLPLTGGTLTGNLVGQGTTFTGMTVNGNASITGNLTGQTAVLAGTSGSFYITDQITQRIINWAPYWYDAWVLATGARVWFGTATGNSAEQLMYLDGSGNLTVGGVITSNNSVNGVNGTIGGVQLVNGNATAGTFFGVNLTLTGSITAAPGGFNNIAGVTFPGNQNIWPESNNVSSCGTAGNAWAICASYNFSQQSDPRGKLDIAPAPDALGKIKKLTVITYRDAGDRRGDAQPLRTGFDAVELNTIHPDAVIYDKDNNPAGYSVSDVNALLWKAVQELLVKVEALEAR